ncbi:MAG: hypothetical protein ACLFWZ_06920 [Coleofasciculus sp.]
MITPGNTFPQSQGERENGLVVLAIRFSQRRKPLQQDLAGT